MTLGGTAREALRPQDLVSIAVAPPDAREIEPCASRLRRNETCGMPATRPNYGIRLEYLSVPVVLDQERRKKRRRSPGRAMPDVHQQLYREIAFVQDYNPPQISAGGRSHWRCDGRN